MLLFKIAISFAPVILFLVGLMLMDSFKLLSPTKIVRTIIVGVLAAIGCLFVARLFLEGLQVPPETYRLYLAPLIEEGAKAAYVAFLIHYKRIGFLVDAAILAFAVGTGFALVENLYYLLSIDSVNPLLWVVRGLGTAVMHGGVTAIFALLSKALDDRKSPFAVAVVLPLMVSTVIHSAFNHVFFSPVINTLLILTILPALLAFVFVRSEASTRDWLGRGMDSDMELLEALSTGDIGESKVGQYLQTLRDRFPGEVIVDMFCYLRLHVELSISAKGLLLLREAGVNVEPEAGTASRVHELRHLHEHIGVTGRLALAPFLRMSNRDLWQIYWLQQ